MIRPLTLLLAVTVIAGCSASIETKKVSVADDDCNIFKQAEETSQNDAKGLRYFKPVRVEVTLYRIMNNKINRIGDVITDVVSDKCQLWEVEYTGALFVNENLVLALSDKGAVKSIGLSNSGSTPAAGTLQAIQKGLETQRDFDKTRDQARIDELNREANLIKAADELRDLLPGKKANP